MKIKKSKMISLLMSNKSLTFKKYFPPPSPSFLFLTYSFSPLVPLPCISVYQHFFSPSRCLPLHSFLFSLCSSALFAVLITPFFDIFHNSLLFLSLASVCVSAFVSLYLCWSLSLCLSLSFADFFFNTPQLSSNLSSSRLLVTRNCNLKFLM